MYGYGYAYWGMIIGATFTLVLLGGLVWLLVWAVRRTSGSAKNAFPSGGGAGPRTAREILDQRYAHGEITRDQYQQMKQDLDG